MKTSRLLFIAGFASLVGCNNAVTYHHSERTSITLEARSTDPQQPIQGNVGVKTRTVVVTPGIEDSSGGFKESTSVISDFKIQKDSKGVFQFGHTNIQSAFITGEAAQFAPKGAAEALSGLSVEPIGDVSTIKRNIMKDVFRLLDQIKDDDPGAKTHLARLNALAKLLPEKYETLKYYEASGKVMSEIDMATYSKKPQEFLEVIQYEEKLINGSIVELNKMFNDRAVKYQDSSGAAPREITKDELKNFKNELKRLQEARNSYFRLIGNHNAIDSAATYIVGKL